MNILRQIKYLIGALAIFLFFQNCTKTFTSNSVFSSLSGNSGATGVQGIHTLSAENSAQALTGTELISDISFQKGINAIKACLNPDTDVTCGQSPQYYIKNPYVSAVATAAPWSLAQWGSLTSLPAQGILAGDHYSFTNDKKFVNLFASGQVELGLNANNELGGQYVTWSAQRKWPHLLLQQNISAPDAQRIEMGTLDTLASLDFNLDIQLLKNDQHRAAGFNSALHTSQFTVYFTVQNLKQGSAGYGQYIWLGVPVFEERSEFPPANIMKDDGTKMMIYSIAYKTFSQVSFQSGQPVNMHADILPFALDAITQAAKSGLVTSGNSSDYKIGGMNMGFEITGLSETVVRFSGLSLKARTGAPAYVPDTPEGFYRVNGGDGIFYSNGRDAFCVFTSWDTLVKWGGDRSAGGIGNRATIPQNMRNDGVCP